MLHLDDNFINKFKEKGAHKFSELYIDMFLKADFDKDFNSFVKASEKISTLWNTFNNNRKILKENLDNTDSLLDTKTIKKHHLELINELENKYINYIKMYDEIEKQQIEKMPNDNEIRNIKKDLEKYFKYKNHRKYGNKAEFEYRNNITHRFGHYVRPEEWKDENYEITEKQIKKTIKKEIEKEIKLKVNYNISTPKGLNSKEFLNHHDVKVEVAKKLKDKGISIPYNFDYSYNQFEKYYKFSILSNYNSSETTFYSKLKDKIGKNDLKLSFNWQQFSKSNFIKDSIKSEIDKINSKNLTYSDINTILNIIESKDLSKFKTDIYIPKVKKELEKFLYIKNDFEDGGKAVEDGNNAIKFLYLPPLALILSMIALILNIITVVVLFLQLINLNRFKIILVKVIFSLFVLFLPFYFNQNLIKNNILISKIEINNEFKIYMNILDWIAYYQDMNVRIHENNKVKFFKKIIYVPTNFK